jgi:putative acetyltransferase
MKIREVRISDAEEISKLKLETLKKINKIDYTKKQLDVLYEMNSVEEVKIKLNEREIFCLEDNKVIIGIVDLKDNKIGGLFVRNDLIRKGSGKKLLEFIEDYARKKGIKKVYLFATKSAQGFYEKFGYEVVERGSLMTRGVKFSKIKMEKMLK